MRTTSQNNLSKEIEVKNEFHTWNPICGISQATLCNSCVLLITQSVAQRIKEKSFAPVVMKNMWWLWPLWEISGIKRPLHIQCSESLLTLLKLKREQRSDCTETVFSYLFLSGIIKDYFEQSLTKMSTVVAVQWNATRKLCEPTDTRRIKFCWSYMGVSSKVRYNKIWCWVTWNSFIHFYEIACVVLCQICRWVSLLCMFVVIN